ncbi:MAG: AI-2E family transporter [Nitrospirae bacterium]|nr:AI-2E family transporter [Nitrospirota bacterium]
MDTTPGRWMKLIFSLLLLGLLVLFLSAVRDLVKLLIISALLAYIMDPLAVFLESRGLGRTAATAVIFLGIILIIGTFMLLAFPVLSREVIAIQDAIQSGQARLMLAKVERYIGDSFGFLGVNSHDLAGRMQSGLAKAGDWIFSHILDMVTLATDLVLIPFMVFFLLKDGREVKKQLISIVPNRYFEFSLNLLYKMDQQLGNYLR